MPDSVATSGPYALRAEISNLYPPVAITDDSAVGFSNVVTDSSFFSPPPGKPSTRAALLFFEREPQTHVWSHVLTVPPPYLFDFRHVAMSKDICVVTLGPMVGVLNNLYDWKYTIYKKNAVSGVWQFLISYDQPNTVNMLGCSVNENGAISLSIQGFT